MWKIWYKTGSPSFKKRIETDGYIEYASVFFDSEEDKFRWNKLDERLTKIGGRKGRNRIKILENNRQSTTEWIIKLFTASNRLTKCDPKAKTKFHNISSRWLKVSLEWAEKIVTLLNTHHKQFSKKKKDKK